MKNKKTFYSFFWVLVFLLQSNVFFAQSKNIQNIYAQGVDAQSDENFYQAQQYYLEVVAINPSYSAAWYNLALCCYKLGEFELAQSYLSNAEKYEKNNLVYLNLKGKILVSLGKLEEGKKIFNDILRIAPNDIESHFGLAEIELFEGRYSGAEKQYKEALKRQQNNRNALLALSILNAERKNFTESENYLNKALSFFSGDAEVHYLAAVIYSIKGDYKKAENQARISVEINSNLEKSYELLTTILFKQKQYQQVLDISDFIISRNRKNATAWYLKGIAYSKQGQDLEAINTWSMGLNNQPQDEIMRMAMELKMREYIEIENKTRANWAEYHVDNASQYKSRFDNQSAIFEYQRALLLDPVNYEARKAYANVLELNGMYELYLEQLKFIKEKNFSSLPKRSQVQVTDKIEAYSSLLNNNLAKKWKVDPFYLDKTRWNIAIFYEDNATSFIHADINNLAACACSDIFSGIAITSVKTQVNPVTSFAQAFKNARQNNFDYFIMVDMNEGSNDITLNSTMYNARTGLQIDKSSFYSTGNNRFSTVLRRFRKSVLDNLTVRGKILKRNGKTVLVDMGKTEGIVKDAKFSIVKKGAVRTIENKPGLTFNEDDVYGVLTITNLGEDISEAVIESHGFYDKINIDDEVILLSLPEQKINNNNPIDNVPTADSKGQPVINTESNGKNLIKEIKRSVEKPSILELLRSIY